MDAGCAGCIKPQATVLSGAGLAGTVTAVSARTATVLLATGASAQAGVRAAGTMEIGLVSGLGRGQEQRSSSVGCRAQPTALPRD